MVYIRLNWNLIEKQISMNSLNCCVRIEGWEKTHLQTWLSRTWSRKTMSWMKFSLFCQHILTPSSLQQLLLLQDSQSIQTILNQTGETTNRNTIINLMSVCFEYWYPRGIRLTCTVVVLIEDHSACRQCLECAVGWVWDTLPYPELKGSGGSDWRQSSIHVSISPEI